MKSTSCQDTTSRRTPAIHGSRVYASAADFCAIFNQDMDSLYTLALLLTGDHGVAQECFLAALNDCRNGSTVFPDWARSWSRRAVIKNAIRLAAPRAGGSDNTSTPRQIEVGKELDPSAGFLLGVEAFDRFAFVLSILERYSVHESAALLACMPREIEEARARVFGKIAAEGRELAPSSPYNGSRRNQENLLLAV